MRPRRGIATEIGDLLHPAESTHRDALEQLGGGALAHGKAHVGLDDAGQHRVDANPLRASSTAPARLNATSPPLAAA